MRFATQSGHAKANAWDAAGSEGQGPTGSGPAAVPQVCLPATHQFSWTAK